MSNVFGGVLSLETIVRPVRDPSQSSIYDPFAGMKTPGQRQLITLQEQVKMGILTVDEAVLHFKEWQLNQKKRSESFRFQQENLKRLRDSITRRQMEKQKKDKAADLEITVPIRHSHNILGKPECGIYEYTPRKNVFPPKNELKRGDWKTESTSSTSKQTLSVTLSTGTLDGKHFHILTLESAQGTGLLFLNPSADPPPQTLHALGWLFSKL